MVLRFLERVSGFSRQQVTRLVKRRTERGSLTKRYQGKAVRRYRYADMMTPYEKLKWLPDDDAFLKPGVTFEALDKDATAMTDNEAAALFTSQRNKIFKQIFKQPKTTDLALDAQAHFTFGKYGIDV